MCTCHPKMKLIFEKEQNKCFNFLDVKVIRENNVFTTSVYRKPIFSGFYTHFDSYMPLNCKFSLVSTIIFRSFTISYEKPEFHQEICRIKDIFLKSVCSEKFIDLCVKTFLNKVFIPKRIVQTAEKKPLFYFIWVWSRLNLSTNYIEHLSNCYQLVTWEWYSKFPHAWKIISISKTKLSENYILY